MMKKSNNNRWIALGLIVLLGTGFLLYRFVWKNGDDDTAPVRSGRGSALSVHGLIVSERPLSFTREISATIEADEAVDLSFETSGKLTHIYFREDAVVQEGELLAKINDQPLQAQLKKLEAQVKLSEDRLYRQSALLEKDAVSREAYEQAQTELAMLQADIELVKANIAQTELRAPFNGVIGFRSVSEGAYVSPTTAVARLTKTVPLKLLFSIPERTIDAVRQGTKVAFTVEGDLETLDAEVYAVSSEVDLSTRQLDVKAIYPNSDGRLVPGRYATVSITLYETENAISVPAEAVVKEMDIDKVFVARGGVAEPVTIEVGQRTDSDVEVITGLLPGDTLITTGTLQLRQGLPIKLENL